MWHVETFDEQLVKINTINMSLSSVSLSLRDIKITNFNTLFLFPFLSLVATGHDFFSINCPLLVLFLVRVETVKIAIEIALFLGVDVLVRASSSVLTHIHIHMMAMVVVIMMVMVPVMMLVVVMISMPLKIPSPVLLFAPTVIFPTIVNQIEQSFLMQKP